MKINLSRIGFSRHINLKYVRNYWKSSAIDFFFSFYEEGIYSEMNQSEAENISMIDTHSSVSFQICQKLAETWSQADQEVVTLPNYIIWNCDKIYCRLLTRTKLVLLSVRESDIQQCFMINTCIIFFISGMVCLSVK